jgi:LmbE family N-acetylglucosaminyl deacetylase
MTHAPWEGARRILVLIPHPDDETAGCCIALMRARAAGAELFGVVLTTGIPAASVLWPWSRKRHPARVERRNAECRAATAALELAQLQFRSLAARQLRSSLLDAYSDLVTLCSDWQIDTLWAPAYEGGHPDHDSTNVLACELVSRHPGLRGFEYAEYNNASGRPASHTFPQAHGTEYDLVPSLEEARFKQQQLATYRSARRDLSYIGLERECFRPLAEYDYTQPPHPGKLFYERFHWVFIRHPSIDFTKGAEVCADLVRFRQALAEVEPRDGTGAQYG